MSALLLEQEGVADVRDFKLGGAGESLTLGERELVVVGTLTLTEVRA